MGVLFIRGVDPSRARDSCETQQSLYVVAKLLWQDLCSPRLSRVLDTSFVHSRLPFDDSTLTFSKLTYKLGLITRLP